MTGRILIAGGLATNRLTLKVRLSAACYDTSTATGPDQLLQMTRELQPDLIVINGGASGLDPAETCAMLRAGDCAATTPILVLCDPHQRLGAMRAGATATLDPRGEEMLLLARIRGLLRDSRNLIDSAFAEAQAAFAGHAQQGDRLPLITLVADSPARALSWKHALSRQLLFRFAISDAEQALAAASGHDGAADLYLIAADLDLPGEGLRLLSELRSRPMSRDAAFVVAVPTEQPELAAIALDLGAGETIPPSLSLPGQIELAAIAIADQIERKRLADRRRDEARQSLIWSITDPLTGLYNRRYALPRLSETLRDARRSGSDCAVLLLDVDHFKRINDLYGHAAGDSVLTEIASRIDQVVSHRGIAARIGGEEFVAILPRTDENAAARCAETIRRAILDHAINLAAVSGGGEVRVTVSIGIAMNTHGILPSTTESSAELMMDRADRALRAAKNVGRNRVIIAPVGAAA